VTPRIRTGGIPQFADFTLHKYRPWNAYSEAVVTGSEIYFASPSEVNDPFDCHFPELVAPAEEQFKQYMQMQYIRMRARDHSSTSGGRLLLDSFVEAAVKAQRTADWSMTVDEAKTTVLEHSSFCSLSEVGDSTLMWSHYAAAHTGVCFIFHYTLHYAFGHVEAVRYTSDFSPLDLFNDWSCDDETLVAAAMYTKHVDWAYEREWRIFNLRKPKGVYAFDPRCLRGLIFGCKMLDADRQRASDLASRRSQPLELYEAVMEPDNRALEILRLRKVTVASNSSSSGREEA
jgi:hypothetical protein